MQLDKEWELLDVGDWVFHSASQEPSRLLEERHYNRAHF